MMHFEAVTAHLEAELKASEERTRELRMVLGALQRRMFPPGAMEPQYASQSGVNVNAANREQYNDAR
jgi:hypothetical protein